MTWDELMRALTLERQSGMPRWDVGDSPANTKKRREDLMEAVTSFDRARKKRAAMRAARTRSTRLEVQP